MEVDQNKLTWLYSEVLFGLCLLYLDTSVYDRVYLLLKDFERLQKEAGEQENHVRCQHNLIRAMMDAKKGNFDAAKAIFEETMVRIEMMYGREHPFMGLALFGMAHLCFVKTQFVDALEYVSSSIEIQRVFYPIAHIAIMNGQYLKSLILDALGCYPEAYSLMTSTLDKLRHLLGTTHVMVARALSGLAVIRQNMGHPKQCQVWLEHCLKLYRASCAENGVDSTATGTCHDIANTLLYLASNHEYSGRCKEAVNLYHEAYTIYCSIAKALRVDDECDVAVAMLGIANMLRLQGKLKNSQALLGKAGIMTMKLFGESSLRSAQCLYSLALLTSDMGKYQEAYSLLVRALGIFKQELPPNHPRIGFVLQSISENFRRVGYFDSGLEPLRSSHSLLTKRFPPNSIPVATSLYVRAKVLCDLGHSTDADLMFQAALVMLREAVGENNFLYLNVLVSTADGLRQQGRAHQAESALRQALLIAKECFDPKHPIVSEVLTSLALILCAGGKPQEAEAVLRENILPLDNELLGATHPHTVYSGGLIGICLNQREENSGQENINLCLNTLCNEKKLSPSHPWVKELGGYPSSIVAKRFPIVPSSPMSASPVSKSAALDNSWSKLEACKKSVMEEVLQQTEQAAVAKEAETNASKPTALEPPSAEKSNIVMPKAAPESIPEASKIDREDEVKKVDETVGVASSSVIQAIHNIQETAMNSSVAVSNGPTSGDLHKVDEPESRNIIDSVSVVIPENPQPQSERPVKSEITDSSTAADSPKPLVEVPRVRVRLTSAEPEITRSSLPKLGGAKIRKKPVECTSPKVDELLNSRMLSSGVISESELDALKIFRETLNSRPATSFSPSPSLEKFNLTSLPDSMSDMPPDFFKTDDFSFLGEMPSSWMSLPEDSTFAPVSDPLLVISPRAASVSPRLVSPRSPRILPPIELSGDGSSNLACLDSPVPILTNQKPQRPLNPNSITLPKLPSTSNQQSDANTFNIPTGNTLFSKTVSPEEMLSMDEIRKTMMSH